MKAKTLVASLVMMMLGGLSGCIVQDIRDEMRSANQQLPRVNDGLDKANVGLDKANGGLDGANAALSRTNGHLQNIDRELARVDQHLAAVQKALAAVDGMVPFLDLGGGGSDSPSTEPISPPPTAATATDATNVSGTSGGGSAASASGAGTATAASTPRDPLEGIWVCQFPEKDHVLIVQPGGKYIRADVDKTNGYILSRGALTREAASTGTPGGETVLRFAPEPSPRPPWMRPSDEAGKAPGKRDEAPVVVNWPEYVMKVVYQGPRSLALSRDGVVYVYSRP